MNKKGMTLVEIIISIVLISIVLIFLFSLLITVKDINDESEVNSTYLINKSLILKNIEEDLSNADLVYLGSCEITDFYNEYGKEDYFKDKDNKDLDDKFKVSKCIKFIYNAEETDVAHLGIYYYKSKESYVISYIHGDVKATRILPDFEKTPSVYSDPSGNYLLKEWKYNNESISGTIPLDKDKFHVINIPIIGPDGKDYSINISYYKST